MTPKQKATAGGSGSKLPRRSDSERDLSAISATSQQVSAGTKGGLK
jgi:hypothetical protein